LSPKFFQSCDIYGLCEQYCASCAIILLFVIGFEFNIREIFNIKYGFIAAFGVIIPWFGGYATAILFDFNMQGAFFVGTALTATSIAITANVLKEINQLQSDAGKAIIGAAVIDDVLSLLALAITEDVVSGSFTLEGVALVFVKALGFMVIFSLLGVFVISNLLMKQDQSKIAEKFPEFVFITAMIDCFSVCYGGGSGWTVWNCRSIPCR
jgi:Kef-type K+ transport system membrane component KefB